MAVELIRADPLSFSRVISHVISLDALPETAKALSDGANILARAAKRVIIDMRAPNGTVQLAEDLPLRHLKEAAGRPQKLICHGNIFRDIGFDGKSSMLGWVVPPSWQQVERFLARALQMRPLIHKQNFIFCGTGAWAFSVGALRDLVHTKRNSITISILGSLDPQGLSNLLSSLDLSTTVCIGISQSGTTLETIMLMETLRDCFDGAGLSYREHFLWLTDSSRSPEDVRSGEDSIRASRGHDWEKVNILPLDVGDHADINALFCVPHSSLFFMAMALGHRGDASAVRHMYVQYIKLADDIARSVVPIADHVASNRIEDFQMDLAEIASPNLENLIIQLIAQSLGSKQHGFNPRMHFASGVTPHATYLELPIPAEIPPLVKAMLTMYALSVFVAVVAYHRDISFVTHPKVNLYKQKAKDLLTTMLLSGERGTSPDISSPGTITDQIRLHLDRHSQTRFVDIVVYGIVPTVHRLRVRDLLASYLRSRASEPEVQISVVHGSDWNHSAYQRAVQAEDSLYVILELQKYRMSVEGVSELRISENVAMLRAIARGTYETLRAKALYFVVDETFFQCGDFVERG
ncbi:hypothetical protein BDW74DRAFT_152291 [Aspergillus multicolor]|uniref:uncharacterized protein n=1 Tax=Aspergillus multicolor TaxID=41759 RepID=UPI003CCCEB1A